MKTKRLINGVLYNRNTATLVLQGNGAAIMQTKHGRYFVWVDSESKCYPLTDMEAAACILEWSDKQ